MKVTMTMSQYEVLKRNSDFFKELEAEILKKHNKIYKYNIPNSRVGSQQVMSAFLDFIGRDEHSLFTYLQELE